MNNNNQAYRSRRDRHDGPSWGGNNDMNPPPKRPRTYAPQGHAHQNYSRHPYNTMGGGGGYIHQTHHMSNPSDYHHRDYSHDHQQNSEPSDPNKLMSFKLFIMKDLPDDIDEAVAATKYKEYKIKWKREQAKAFFDAHKEEEWFIEKYRPPERQKRLRQQRQNRKKRLAAFMELLEQGWMDDVRVDYQEAYKLQKFLDAVVVKLEGGTEHDLQLLNESYRTESKTSADMKAYSEEAEKLKLEQLQKQRERSTENSNNQPDDPNNSIDNSTSNDNVNNNSSNNNEDTRTKDEDEGIDCDDKRGGSAEGSQQQPKIKIEEGEINNEQDGDDVLQTEAKQEQKQGSGTEETTHASQDLEDVAKNERSLLHETSSIFLPTVPAGVTRQELEEIGSKFDGFLRVALSEPQFKDFSRRAWITFRHIPNQNKLRSLCWSIKAMKIHGHETSAIMNRDFSKRVRSAPGVFQHKLVVKADIKNVVSIIMHLDKKMGVWQDDVVEKRVEEQLANPDTSTEKDNKEEDENKKGSDVKKEDEASATGQLDQSDPQQSSEEPSQEESLPSRHETEAEQSKINDSNEQGGDKCRTDEEQQQQQKQEPQLQDKLDSKPEPMAVDDEGEIVDDSSVECKNPLLEDIKEYLIEESDTEEHELIGSVNKEEGEDSTKIDVVRDENLEKVLDKLLLYLRVVHSVDYYSASEYQNEDDMPHRLGLMWARGLLHSSEIALSEIKAKIKTHSASIKHLVEEPTISEIEQKQLGRMDPEVAIEDFIQANTHKIESGKYLCPLSNKKFISEDYVRKHIFNRQRPALDEVRLETEYYNNYVADPRRPTPI